MTKSLSFWLSGYGSDRGSLAALVKTDADMMGPGSREKSPDLLASGPYQQRSIHLQTALGRRTLVLLFRRPLARAVLKGAPISPGVGVTASSFISRIQL